MAINLELPKKLQAVIEKGHQGAAEMLRPISRKYDSKEHAYPVELDTIATLFEGISEAKTISFAGHEAFRDGADGPKGNINGGNMSAVLNIMEVSWGDVGLVLSIPLPGVGQRGDLRRRDRRATRAARQGVGRDGDHRAGLRLRLGRGLDHRHARRR